MRFIFIINHIINMFFFYFYFVIPCSKIRWKTSKVTDACLPVSDYYALCPPAVSCFPSFDSFILFYWDVSYMFFIAYWWLKITWNIKNIAAYYFFRFFTKKQNNEWIISIWLYLKIDYLKYRNLKIQKIPNFWIFKFL